MYYQTLKENDAQNNDETSLLCAIIFIIGANASMFCVPMISVSKLETFSLIQTKKIQKSARILIDGTTFRKMSS